MREKSGLLPPAPLREEQEMSLRNKWQQYTGHHEIGALEDKCGVALSLPRCCPACAWRKRVLPCLLVGFPSWRVDGTTAPPSTELFALNVGIMDPLPECQTHP